jgi:hypothetical protein
MLPNTCAGGRVFIGVEVPLLLQFSIALFTGMVAATLVPPVRKSIPRPIEIGFWVALVVVCVIGVISITNPNARELTTSAFWGVDQVINTLIGLMGAGVLAWIVDHRFTIATCVVLVLAVDVLALAMVRSYRQARAWAPQVRLGEWMVLPRRSLTPEPVVVPYALDELNRKWAAAFAVAGAALLAWLVNFSIWARDILLPRQAERLAHAAAVGRVESRARLESLRDTASQLQYAARSWYTAAGAPAVNGLGAKATEAVRTARSARGGGEPAGLNARRVADIHVLLSAQSIGAYGPVRPATVVTVGEEEEDATGQTDRLAS